MNGTDHRTPAAPGSAPRRNAEPLRGDQRIELLDALRGMALFGVLFVNTAWFATAGIGDAVARHDVLAATRVDRWVDAAMQLFVFAKANTIFTLLFGIGFALQMQRLQQRGDEAMVVYLRRLFGLLALGALHLFGVWKGEILHVYALAGFVLVLCWRWRTAWLVACGLLLTLVIHPALLRAEAWSQALAICSPSAPPAGGDGQAHAFRGTSYADIVLTQWQMMLGNGYLFAGLVSWVVYALGRFMLGAALARSGLLFDPLAHRRRLAAATAWLLPAGLVLTALRWLIQWGHARGWWGLDADQLRGLIGVAQQLGTLMLALSYIAVAAWLWTQPDWRARLERFAVVGRMALTNYLLQSVANALLFFGFGLGLVGKVGITACLLLSLVVYAAQLSFSRWWLRRHPYGPTEWLWRWWTYRQRPAWRLV